MCDNCERNSAKNHPFSYENVEKLANYLKERVPIVPQIGIICGTGLGGVTELLTDSTIFDYKDIPGFPVSTVPGHHGRLLFGRIGSTPVVVMQGRFYFYEGNSLWKCTLPVRVMKLLGVSTLIMSNAAGAINSSYNVGDIMLVRDHINLSTFGGNNPLRGPNDDKFGPRFGTMNDAYDRRILVEAKGVVKSLGMSGVQEGVYACIGGPSFETVAELRALRKLGADAVGMSTVHEVVVARHCGLKCFAFCLITNKCSMEYDSKEKQDHEEHLMVGKQREDDLKNFVEKLVLRLTGANLA
jgi:purine-nucleoside phosphorylase